MSSDSVPGLLKLIIMQQIILPTKPYMYHCTKEYHNKHATQVKYKKKVATDQREEGTAYWEGAMGQAGRGHLRDDLEVKQQEAGLYKYLQAVLVRHPMGRD